jgi:hypothetical protein
MARRRDDDFILPLALDASSPSPVPSHAAMMTRRYHPASSPAYNAKKARYVCARNFVPFLEGMLSESP